MKIISIKVTVRSVVLCMGTMDSCPVVTQANEPHTNLCMLYTAYFLIFKHWFCWKYQYVIHHLHFMQCLFHIKWYDKVNQKPNIEEGQTM